MPGSIPGKWSKRLPEKEWSKGSRARDLARGAAGAMRETFDPLDVVSGPFGAVKQAGKLTLRKALPDIPELLSSVAGNPSYLHFGPSKKGKVAVEKVKEYIQRLFPTFKVDVASMGAEELLPSHSKFRVQFRNKVSGTDTSPPKDFDKMIRGEVPSVRGRLEPIAPDEVTPFEVRQLTGGVFSGRQPIKIGGK